MKKLIILLLFIPILSFGQIKKVDESTEPVVVGQAKNFTVVIATMNKIAGDPDYYFVTFNNIKYETLTDIKSFGFLDVDGAFDYLYSAVAAAAKAGKKEIDFDLKDGRLSIDIVKALGVVNVQFRWIENTVLSYSGYMTPKQYAKLFAKKYDKKDWK
tara:strand:+ start:65 stop:535 length:471 start_codon:yes stop_codon:yes gene_type:complete